jgi:hypothetical protein
MQPNTSSHSKSLRARASDLLNTNGDEVPSRPENPPVIPLLQPYLPLQGDDDDDDYDDDDDDNDDDDNDDDDDDGDDDDVRSHGWTPTATSSKISLLTILASTPS